MLLEKTNISARVDITLKKIVEDSTFTHIRTWSKTDSYGKRTGYYSGDKHQS